MRTRAITAALAGLVIVAAAGCSSGSTAGSAGPSTTTSTTTSTTGTASATATPGTALVPLWPFTTVAQVQQWQAAFRSGGHQPWHLDAGQTALEFVRGDLGYTDVERVTTSSVVGPDAHVGVGWLVPESTRQSTVAVLHLMRFGQGDDAPWVVVGTDDTTLTLDRPSYGSTVSSPLTVGGVITGVDESLRVLVLGSSATPLATSAPLPAGGVRTPWSTTLRFTVPAGTVLTVAVSTGGHLMRVERFAITAVRAG